MTNKEAVEYLWQLLDDIDTVGDIAKGNDKLYRKLIEQIHPKRREVAESKDGLTLIYKTEEG